MKNIPSGADLAQYSVNRTGQVEVVRQSLYDYQIYAQAGQPQLSFFANPIGQGTTSHPGSAGPKTRADTNMTLPGQLPAPIKYLVRSIELDFLPGVEPSLGYAANAPSAFVNDLYNVGRSGYLVFTIGSKDYLIEAPLHKFPPKTRFRTNSSQSDATTAAAAQFSQTASGYWDGRAYVLDAPLYLESTQNFSITLNWPNAVALAAADTTARIGVILDGLLYRLSQ